MMLPFLTTSKCFTCPVYVSGTFTCPVHNPILMEANTDGQPCPVPMTQKMENGC